MIIFVLNYIPSLPLSVSPSWNFPEKIVYIYIVQVHICSSFILNGVCVRWRGWLDLEKLEGVGCLELDLDLVTKEENLLQRQLALVQQKLRECEELYRGGDYHMVSCSTVLGSLSG